jgi:D-arabinose 1-dehydrogenase-like Zn-dependent alcohol dehydrogenase
MLTVDAYAATSPTDPLVPTTITRRDVGPKDVLIEIAYAGVCHSDIHTVRGEWGPITYPQVVGHEVVGTVVAAGAEASKHTAACWTSDSGSGSRGSALQSGASDFSNSNHLPEC